MENITNFQIRALLWGTRINTLETCWNSKWYGDHAVIIRGCRIYIPSWILFSDFLLLLLERQRSRKGYTWDTKTLPFMELMGLFYFQFQSYPRFRLSDRLTRIAPNRILEFGWNSSVLISIILKTASLVVNNSLGHFLDNSDHSIIFQTSS